MFDDWGSCQNTNWEITKSSGDYAEVKYTCQVKGIDKIISALKEKFEIIQKENVLRLRKLEQDLERTKNGLQEAACTTNLLLDEVSAGYIVKRSESLLTDDEWKAVLNEYKKNENEILDKITKQLFTSEAEVEGYRSKQRNLIEKFDHGVSQPTYIFSQSNPEVLQDESNENHKKIQEKVLACLNKIPNSGDIKTNGTAIRFYIAEGAITLFNGSVSDIAVDLFKLQEELTSYDKKQNYNALKQIKVVVLFGVNESNAEIKQSHIEFLIGENAKQIPYTKNEISDIIYSNINLSDELSKANGIANLF